MPSVYTLTSLTGRTKNAGRTMLVQGFEVGRSTVLVFGISFGIAVVPSWLAWLAFGVYGAVFTPAIIIGGAFWFWQHRSRKGLNLPMYRTLLDKRKKTSKVGQIYICFTPISQALGPATIVASSELAPIPEEERPKPIYTSPNRPKHRNRMRP